MSVQLVNGYVLFPNPPDWGDRLRMRREWRTTIAEGVTGAEDRSSFRHLPLRGIEYGVLPLSLEEDRKLITRVLAAKRSGLAAVPFWGRGVALASVATGTTVTLADEEAWEWAPDDHVFFSDQDHDACEISQIQAVSGATLTLKSALAGSYRGFCWPLLFGHFRCEEIGILTSHHGSLRIAVIERDIKPEANPDLCAIILLVDGGGDTFDCYPEDVTLDGYGAGTFFTGPWVDNPVFVGMQSVEPFDGYSPGVAIHNLSKGTGWAGAWVDADLFASLRALEHFESYDSGLALHGLGDGSGFDAAWVDSSLG